MGLREAAKGILAELIGKPEELAELRDALKALPPPPPPGRPVMSADERRALGAELAQRYDLVVVQGGEQARRETAEAQARLSQAQADLARIAEVHSEKCSQYVAWRDVVLARLWAERPDKVDKLLERAEGEARALCADVHVLPPYVQIVSDARGAGEIISNGLNEADMARPVTNSASIESRRKGLFALAHEVREWTCKGMFASGNELQEMFDHAYRALPSVEPLADVMRRDIRGRRFVAPTPRPPLPAA
jgi:hypothetical protein